MMVVDRIDNIVREILEPATPIKFNDAEFFLLRETDMDKKIIIYRVLREVTMFTEEME